MEKARKLEITKVLKKCSEEGTSHIIAMVKLAMEHKVTQDELIEFFALSKEERLELYYEIVKVQTNYTILQLKLAAILQKCYKSDNGPDVCLGLMLSMTEASIEDCVDFMMLASDEHNKMFNEVNKIKSYS